MDGGWGDQSKFVLNGVYEQRYENFMTSQDFNIGLTGSMFQPMEFSYLWQANSTFSDAQFQVQTKSLLDQRIL